jgi:hypothetical protein
MMEEVWTKLRGIGLGVVKYCHRQRAVATHIL